MVFATRIDNATITAVGISGAPPNPSRRRWGEDVPR